jgi:benzoyl-CoA 2,3-epoxidase subunit A
MTATAELLKQHVIDPVICIRCNTCEATCPTGAVTHDDRNYVVDADKCNFCMACVPPCPTGSIDNWRTVIKAKAYSVKEQLSWDDLPAEKSADELGGAAVNVTQTTAEAPAAHTASISTPVDGEKYSTAQFNSTLPPWSAAHPYTNLFGPKSAKQTITATCTGNHRVTQKGTDYDTHHIVLDFGTQAFPTLEGQSIGIVPPGLDSHGKPHKPRQYSIASARNGERPGYNNISLTVKRVLEDHSGEPVRGAASNYVCDLKVGDTVEIVGPFGSTFLMPNHPKSHLVMICTGTGSAPMRAMTEWRRRLRDSGKFEGGKLMLFFGARTKEELPYFGPLQTLPKDFIDIEFAFSRAENQPKKYVQDSLRERAADVAKLLQDDNAYFYVCGLKAMEEGVVHALRDIANGAGLPWNDIVAALKNKSRLHLETY